MKNHSETYPTAADLSLHEKLQLFAGKDTWHFAGVERLGILPLQVADCGHGVTLVAPPYGSATCFPTAIGMAATWNCGLLFDVGKALGRETRAKGCGMLLGPMVNLHRLPCGGRNYETFSEDPVLTGNLAAALIKGLQAEGTGACVKSFACNNQQKNQKQFSAEVDEQTLRELYLKVYTCIFRQVMPWAVMTSYNPLNGMPPSDSGYWIQKILREEMGFSGVIISDWNAVQSDEAITSGLDIEMPGPGKVLTPLNLQNALDAGRLEMKEIDARTNRILDLHSKVCKTRRNSSSCSPPELNSTCHQQLTLAVAEESIVLLKNENDTLPLSRDRIRTLAVIGPNAASARLGGGGSASVLPPYSISVLEGIRRIAGNNVNIIHCEGCALGNDLPAIPTEAFAPDSTYNFGQGLSAEYFDIHSFTTGGAPISRQSDSLIDFSWGWAAPAEGVPRGEYAIRWTGFVRAPTTGPLILNISSRQGIARVWLDGELKLDCWSQYDCSNFEDKYTNRQAAVDLHMEQMQPVSITIEYMKTGPNGGLRLGWKTPGQEDSIATASRIAAKADCAIIVGGLSNMFEGGNNDRETFSLPGSQEQLIQAVTAANPCTVVVLYNGTPVNFSTWRDRVPAILEAFYPGQEGGTAIARILFGEVNPSGKLPDTFPKSWDEVPAMSNYPGSHGKVHYAEKRMVGYRYYDTAEIEPEFPFGFGLSYTKFSYSLPRLAVNELFIDITNTGNMNGKEIVQLYLERCNPEPGQPVRELLNFEKISLVPGECKTVCFQLLKQDFLTYDPATGRQQLTTQNLRLAVGSSSRDLQSVPFPFTSSILVIWLTANPVDE